jgi:hypothetical protein
MTKANDKRPVNPPVNELFNAISQWTIWGPSVVDCCQNLPPSHYYCSALWKKEKKTLLANKNSPAAFPEIPGPLVGGGSL